MGKSRCIKTRHAIRKSVKVLPIILQATLDTHRNRIEDRGRNNKEHLNLGGDKLEDVQRLVEEVINTA
jgi:hypothetical protein